MSLIIVLHLWSSIVLTLLIEAHARPPNFLLVDYYNIGGFNGSVFEVAAVANNVTYDQKCCGYALTSSAEILQPRLLVLFLIVGISVLL